MKNTFAFLLFSGLFFSSCSHDASLAPSVNVDSIYVNDEKWELSSLDLVNSNSQIKIFATLVDNDGSGLYTFNVRSEYKIYDDFPEETIEEDTEVIIVEKVEEDISESNMSSETTLWFKDNVRETNVTIQTEVPRIMENMVELTLLLNVNVKGFGEGSLEEVTFRIARYQPDYLFTSEN